MRLAGAVASGTRRKDDAGAVEVVEDDEDDTGDGDRTRGDDGTSGGANTGDGGRTRGDDGTAGGENTRDNDRSRADRTGVDRTS